ncbi:hypothetical protein BegalDRAFT_0246 [Beggiatoa alba B18LD]|uniref:Uncharacterized protein n=1 Tax=Beggiatoa alba B18LD TaxID=395493 RepID=I3CC25_9GAMM|nr:hypothetical protein [Beggiatoa alba]EIJ41168.1 hypothetical protein BegalDRAFT_0246 [Beggiatoa alba B18LD]
MKRYGYYGGISLIFACLYIILVNNHIVASPPVLSPAKQAFSATQACVEPIETIRRQHGDALKYRHRLANKGIYTSGYRFIDCINCHITPTATGQYPIKDSPQHFCNACHTYVAVQIDCFNCHASTPRGN